MKKIFKLIFVFIFLINFIAFTKAEEQNYKILKLVNDKVITNYDLEQRLRLFSFLNKIPLNEDNMKPYADEMLKLMIDEKLQREQIKKYKVQVQSIEIDDYIIEVFLASEQNINDQRKLVIQIWYPTNVDSQEKYPYIDNPEKRLGPDLSVN